MKIVRLLPVLALFVSAVTMLTVPAQATPIVWTLQGVTLSDQSTASGSFAYDAAIDTYSNWNLSVTAGPSFTAYIYQPAVDNGFVGIHSADQVDFVAFPPATGGRYIRLTFLSPLTDVGGVISLLTDQSGFECNNCFPSRYITGGSVTAVAAVPEASTFMLLTGGAVIGGLLKKFASWK